MLVARDLPSLGTALSRIGRPVALVPTMGALHAGHAALLDAATACGLPVAASIFVNPTQFAAAADAAAYPRDESADLALLRTHGCAVAWLPPAEVMYPDGFATTIVPAGAALGFEGDARPGHFAGVATVVTKLLLQIEPVAAYFGEKDWQQLQMVRQLVADLGLPARIVGVPSVRDADGLALSSRNRFLSASERPMAALLARTLRDAAARLRNGADVPPTLADAIDALRASGYLPDYLALIDGKAVRSIDRVRAGARLIAAARLGTVRLLDNWHVA